MYIYLGEGGKRDIVHRENTIVRKLGRISSNLDEKYRYDIRCRI